MDEEKRPPPKAHLEKPLPAIASMLGDFLQHQAEDPRLKYAYWDSEMDC